MIHVQSTVTAMTNKQQHYLFNVKPGGVGKIQHHFRGVQKLLPATQIADHGVRYTYVYSGMMMHHAHVHVPNPDVANKHTRRLAGITVKKKRRDHSR